MNTYKKQTNLLQLSIIKEEDIEHSIKMEKLSKKNKKVTRDTKSNMDDTMAQAS